MYGSNLTHQEQNQSKPSSTMIILGCDHWSEGLLILINQIDYIKSTRKLVDLTVERNQKARKFSYTKSLLKIVSHSSYEHMLKT